MRKVWLILADQLSYKFVGYNGLNSWISTPSLNYIAGKSIVYNQAYCSSPLCIPSRQSLYTGRTTRYHQCICDYRVLDKPTMFHYLSDFGLKSYAAGKLDFRFDDDQFHGITARPNAERGAQDVFPGVNNFSSFVPEKMVTTLDRENDDQCCQITETTLQVLKEKDASLVVTSYVKPHESWDNGMWWDAPKRFWEPYAKWKLPNQIRGYAANVSLLDEHVGYVFWQAGEQGLLDDTLVIFASDHGELAGEHGRWGKQCMHEEAIRVPMIMWHKDIEPKKINSVVGLIDIFPTIFDWLGVPCPPCDGISLLGDRPDDYHVFIEVFWGKFVDGRYCDFEHKPLDFADAVDKLKRCIRRHQWKYLNEGGRTNLFYVTHNSSKRMSSISPKLANRYQIEMESRYPVEEIISKSMFDRKIHDKAFG